MVTLLIKYQHFTFIIMKDLMNNFVIVTQTLAILLGLAGSINCNLNPVLANVFGSSGILNVNEATTHN